MPSTVFCNERAQHSTARSSWDCLQEQTSCIILPQSSSQRGPKAAGSCLLPPHALLHGNTSVYQQGNTEKNE